MFKSCSCGTAVGLWRGCGGLYPDSRLLFSGNWSIVSMSQSAAGWFQVAKKYFVSHWTQGSLKTAYAWTFVEKDWMFLLFAS